MKILWLLLYIGSIHAWGWCLLNQWYILPCLFYISPFLFTSTAWSTKQIKRKAQVKIFPKTDIHTTLSIFSETICLNQYKWNPVIFGNCNVIQCGTVGISVRACVCVELPICIIVPQLRFLAECPKFPNYHNCAKILNKQKD